MRKAQIGTMFVMSIVLAAIVFVIVSIVGANRHEWHSLSGIKWGVVLEEAEQKTEQPTKPYVKERLTWRSDRADEDTVIWAWGPSDNSITATMLDYGPDANVWVELEWCSRHNEIRAVRVE